MAAVQPKILVVEDSFLVAMDLKQMATKCGCLVIGPVPNVREGLEAIRENRLDGAVLDVNLGDERVWKIAETLEESAIPFVFITGYAPTEIPDRFRDRPVLEKPPSAKALMTALAEIGVVSR